MTGRNESYRALTLTEKLASSTWIILVLTAGLSFLVYILTSYRTVTWWKNVEYITACRDLGVAHPPGSLLTTVLGWVVTKLAVCGSFAFALNIFAGLLAVAVVITATIIASGLERYIYDRIAGTKAVKAAILIAAAIGSLTLAFSQTFWLYAVKYTPYMLTVFFTGIILAGILGWYRQADHGRSYLWLFLIALLFGLDLSVHRTNLLLAPGFLIFLLIFRPALFSKARNWLFAAIGLAAGLAFHLLIIPMAAADPYLNSGSPDNLERFWQYVSLKQYGGGFLFDLLPRKAPFWSVQVIDYLRAFSANFFNWQGRISPLGLLPGFFGLIGIISLWRRDRRLSLGLIILFLFASLGAVIYLNIPENFFRAMYRHYLPSFFIFTIWMAYGIGSLLLAIIRLFSHRAGSAYAIAAVLLLLLPGYQLWSNYNIRNFHNHYFTYDWARNVFATLPENSIIYCFGDNDTHPLWYLQAVENARPDVAILNIGLTNIRWYMHQIAEHHPDLLFHNGDPALSFGPRPWTDTTISIPAEIDREEFDLGEEIELPDSVHLTVTPDLAGKYILPQHSLLLNLIKNNQWQRPIYFSIGGQGILPEWLAPYLRFEGLAFRLVPVPQVPLNPDILARNLMEEYSYRGYADEGIYLDDVTRKNGIDYLAGLLQLAQIMVEKDDQRAYQEIRRFVKNNLPPEKLQPLPLPLKKAVDIIFEKDPPAPDKEFPENDEGKT